MDNDIIEMISEPEEEIFIIDNDAKAEWAIRKIKEKQEYRDRLVAACKESISLYEMKIDKYNERFNSDCESLYAKLSSYFRGVKHRETKTMKAYDLPSGQLRLTKERESLKKDDKELLNYLKANQLSKYIKMSESVDWENLKKTLKINNGYAVNQDGEVIDGVRVEVKPSEFKVVI